jgi:hypothetical protein
VSDDGDADRPLDPMAMAADLIGLGSRRPDLTEGQRSELYFAALHRFRDFPGGETGLAHTWQIFAWIDIVSPQEGHVPSQEEILQEDAICALIGRDPDRLLLGPEPAFTAAPLAAHAHKRSDLSVVQRHELLVAARSHLARPGYGRKFMATTGAIFAWIDVVVPVRTPVTDELALASMVSPHLEANHSQPAAEPSASHLVRTAKPGPSPMLTREQVERTGQDLASRCQPAGERSIAHELGVSRDAVRYALGKDPRRRPQS